MEKQLQFRCDKTTLLLDGRVVEYFYEGWSDSKRYHVDALKMEATPDGMGLKVRFGMQSSGTFIDGGKMKVPAEQVAELEAFVNAAIEADILVERDRQG
jgi:hypothetical protein